jgi:hypothetical protein
MSASVGMNKFMLLAIRLAANAALADIKIRIPTGASEFVINF